MEQLEGCYGCRSLARRITEADATIAALQARVQVLEAEVDTLTQQEESWESQLTQRTAELEAAKAELNTVRRDAGLDCGDHSCLYAMNKTGMRTNGGCRCSPKRMKNDLERSRKAYDDLQAELERVRSLIKALPKVEGELTCSQQFDSAWRLQYWQVEAYGVADECLYRLSNLRKEEADAYAALLQHRQWMEG